ncbi:MAG: hypothetical protein HYV39_03615 [Candidatus Levybacteria bacterium]|nr:hypothetical protein [Candidatus Levybacteria bacterium]
MPVIKFSYTPEVFINQETGKVNYIYRPLIPTRLCNKHIFSKFPVNCLLDSGADKNLFPAEWGEMVRLKIKSGKEVTHYGIGKKDIKAYRHKVKLYIGVYHFETEADFSYEQQFPLLGREGFFKYFERITFREKDHIVTLEY